MPGIDINFFIRQANKLTKDIEKRKQELAEESIEGSAGEGLVTAVVSGVQDLKSVRIDPKALEGGDKAMLEDLIVAAVNQAMKKAKELHEKEMAKVTGGLSLPGLM